MIAHAQCWVHRRRKFIEVETEYPDRVKEALAMIGTLYKKEERIEAQGLDETRKRERRIEKSKPVVDQFFEWCQQLNAGDYCLRAHSRQNYALLSKIKDRGNPSLHIFLCEFHMKNYRIIVYLKI